MVQCYNSEQKINHILLLVTLFAGGLNWSFLVTFPNCVYNNYTPHLWELWTVWEALWSQMDLRIILIPTSLSFSFRFIQQMCAWIPVLQYSDSDHAWDFNKKDMGGTNSQSFQLHLLLEVTLRADILVCFLVCGISINLNNILNNVETNICINSPITFFISTL
jgi:hypothetical protein